MNSTRKFAFCSVALLLFVGMFIGATLAETPVNYEERIDELNGSVQDAANLDPTDFTINITTADDITVKTTDVAADIDVSVENGALVLSDTSSNESVYDIAIAYEDIAQYVNNGTVPMSHTDDNGTVDAFWDQKVENVSGFAVFEDLPFSTVTIGYSYVPITITGSAQEGYQLNITIPYKTGMNADFSNIRFFANNTSYDGGASLPYWMENYTDSNNARVWIPLARATPRIYCEWGIADENTSESNGSAVFDFFDGFDDATLNSTSWLSPSSNYTVADGKLRIWSTVSRVIGKYEINTSAQVLRWSGNSTIANTLGSGITNVSSTTQSGTDRWQGHLSGSPLTATAYNGGTGGTPATFSPTMNMAANSFYTFELRKVGGKFNGTVQNGTIFSSASNGESSVITAETKGYFYGTSLVNGHYTSFDYVAVRKYNATPPTASVSSTITNASTANFTSNITAGAIPLAIKFYNTSTNNPTSYLWDFGDGNTSTEANPIHEYASIGKYTVSLYVQSTAGNSTITTTDYVNATTPFTLSQTTPKQYWIDDNNNTWVSVNLTPNNETVLVVAKTSGYKADGTRVFPFFDNFTAGSLNTTKWISNAYINTTIGANGLIQSSNSGATYTSYLRTVSNLVPINTTYNFEGKARPMSVNNSSIEISLNAGHSYLILAVNNSTTATYYNTTFYNNISNTSWSENEYKHFIIEEHANSTVDYKIYDNKDNLAGAVYNKPFLYTMTSARYAFYLSDGPATTSRVLDAYWKYVFMRNNTEIEPTITGFNGTNNGYYYIKIKNNNNTTLQNYQIKLPADLTGVASENDSLYIEQLDVNVNKNDETITYINDTNTDNRSFGLNSITPATHLWYLDGDLIQTNTSVVTSQFIFNYTYIATHNLTSFIEYGNNTTIKVKTWNLGVLNTTGKTYWIDDNNNTWVNATIPANGKAIFQVFKTNNTSSMYGAEPRNLFLFYDDFKNGINTSIWNINGVTSPSPGYIKSSTFGSDQSTISKSGNYYSSSYIFDLKMLHPVVNNSTYCLYYKIGAMQGYFWNGTPSTAQVYNSTNSTYWNLTQFWKADEYNRFVFKQSAKATVSVYNNTDSLITTANQTTPASYGITIYDDQTPTTKLMDSIWKYIIIRSYVNIDPTITTIDTGKGYYLVTVENKNNVALTNAQISIPTANIGVSSQADSVFISQLDTNFTPTTAKITVSPNTPTQFFANSYGANTYWYLDNVLVQENTSYVNGSSEIYTFNDSVPRAHNLTAFTKYEKNNDEVDQLTTNYTWEVTVRQREGADYWVDGNYGVWTNVNISPSETTKVVIYKGGSKTANGSAVFRDFFDFNSSARFSSQWSASNIGLSASQHYIYSTAGASLSSFELPSAKYDESLVYDMKTAPTVANSTTSVLYYVTPTAKGHLWYGNPSRLTYSDNLNINLTLDEGNWQNNTTRRFVIKADRNNKTNDFYLYDNSNNLTASALGKAFYPILPFSQDVTFADSMYGSASDNVSNSVWEYFIIRKYAPIEPSINIEDFGSYIVASVTNPNNITLTNFEVRIPGDSLGMSSTTDQLYVSTDNFDPMESGVPLETSYNNTPTVFTTTAPISAEHTWYINGTLMQTDLDSYVSTFTIPSDIIANGSVLNLTTYIKYANITTAKIWNVAPTVKDDVKPYWIDPATNKVYTKVTLMPNTTTTLYVAKTNTSDFSSNGSAVFPFFEGFDNGVVDSNKYLASENATFVNTTRGAIPYYVNLTAYGDGKLAYIVNNTNSVDTFYTKDTFQRPYTCEVTVSSLGAASYAGLYIADDNITDTNLSTCGLYGMYNRMDSDLVYIYYGNTANVTHNSLPKYKGVEYNAKIDILPTVGCNMTEYNGTDYIHLSNFYTDQKTRVGLSSKVYSSNSTTIYDNLRVYPYQSYKPTITYTNMGDYYRVNITGDSTQRTDYIITLPTAQLGMGVNVYGNESLVITEAIRNPINSSIWLLTGNNTSLNVTLPETSNVSWLVDGTPIVNYTDVTYAEFDTTTISPALSVGSHVVSLFGQNGSTVYNIPWNITYFAPCNITGMTTTNSYNKILNNSTVTYTAHTENTDVVTWFVNGNISQQNFTSAEYLSGSASFTVPVNATLGDYNVTAYATNSVSNDTQAVFFEIIPYNTAFRVGLPQSNINNVSSVTLYDTGNVSWYLNGELVQTDNNTLTSEYTVPQNLVQPINSIRVVGNDGFIITTQYCSLYDNPTAQSYWIDDDNLDIWAKYTIEPHTTNIYYFKLDNNTQTQNPDDVFIFFDDFEGTTLNESKWVITSNATAPIQAPTVSNSALEMNVSSLLGSYLNLTSTQKIPLDNVSVHYKYMTKTSTTNYYDTFYGATLSDEPTNTSGFGIGGRETRVIASYNNTTSFSTTTLLYQNTTTNIGTTYPTNYVGQIVNLTNNTLNVTTTQALGYNTFAPRYSGAYVPSNETGSLSIKIVGMTGGYISRYRYVKTDHIFVNKLNRENEPIVNVTPFADGIYKVSVANTKDTVISDYQIAVNLTSLGATYTNTTPVYIWSYTTATSPVGVDVGMLSNKTQTFSIEPVEPMNMTWFVDDVVVKVDNETQESNIVVNGSSGIGLHNVTVTTTSIWSDPYTKTWNLSINPACNILTNSTTYSNAVVLEGTNVTYAITSNYTDLVSWYVNGELQQSNVSDDASSFIFNSSQLGLNNITAIANNSFSADAKTWTITVSPFVSIENYSTNPENILQNDHTVYSLNTSWATQVEWFVDGELAKTDNDVGATNTSNYTFIAPTIGAKNITAVVSNALSSLQQQWNITVIPACSITGYNSTNNTENISRNIVVVYNVTTQNADNIDWYVDGVLAQNNTGVNESIFNYTTSEIGIHNISVFANNSVSSANHTWDINVFDICVINNANANNTRAKVDTGTHINYTINASYVDSAKWYVNGELVQTDSTNDSSYIFDETAIGDYNITVTVENIYSADHRTWNVSVRQVGAIPYYIDENLNVWMNVSVSKYTIQTIKVINDNAYMAMPESVFTFYDDFSENTNEYKELSYNGGNYKPATYANVTDGYMHIGYNGTETGSSLIYANKSIDQSGNYLLVAKYNASGVAASGSMNQKEIGLTQAVVTPSVYTNCDPNADYIGWSLSEIIGMDSYNGQTSNMVRSTQAYAIADNESYHPAVWIQDASEVDQGSEMWMDYMYVAKTATSELPTNVSNGAGFKNVTVSTSGEGVVNYQFYIAGAELGITSVDQGLNISYSTSERIPTPPAFLNYTPTIENPETSVQTEQSFNVIANQTGNISWYIDDVLEQENSSVENAIFNNTPTIFGNKNVTVFFENDNGTISHYWNWTVVSNGILNVSTIPSGSDVYINNTYIGTSPTSTEFTEGYYEVTVAHEDYENNTSIAFVTAGSTTRYQVNLTGLPGAVTVSSTPTSAKIYIDNTPYSTTPRTIPLSAGNHTMLITAAGYVSNTSTITIPANHTLVAHVNLTENEAPPEGNETPTNLATLKINTNPLMSPIYIDDDIYVGSQSNAGAPVTKYYEAGTYNLTVSHEDYKTSIQTVTLTANNTTTLTVNLEPINGTLFVITDPENATVYLNGTLLGQLSPVQVNELVPGDYNVTISKDTYSTENRVVTVLPNKTLELNVTMQKPAYAHITTVPTGASIYIDDGLQDENNNNIGYLAGTSPIENMTLTEGSHKVTARITGYYETSTTTTFAPNVLTSVELQLTGHPTTGVFNITNLPAGAYYTLHGGSYEGGSSYSNTTPNATIAYSGTYDVTIRCPDYQPYAGTVTIVAGQVTSYAPTLIPLNGTLIISVTDPDMCNVFINGNLSGITRNTTQQYTPAGVTPSYFSLPAGDYVIRLEKTGYGADVNGTTTYSAGIHIASNRSSYITTRLYPALFDGRMNVTVSPQDSDIYLDGVYCGKGPMVSIYPVPATSSWKLPYSHNLTVMRDGYTTHTTMYQMPSAGTVTALVTLYPDGTSGHGSLLVTSPQDNVNVTVDGTYLGQTDIQTTLTTGSHTVVVSKTGYVTQTHTVSIQDDSIYTLNADMVMQDSTLIVSTTPDGGLIYINDQLQPIRNEGGDIIGYRQTPYTFTRQAGTYVVKVTKLGYNSVIKTVALNPGETVTMSDVMTAIPPVSTPDDPAEADIVTGESLSDTSVITGHSTILTVNTNASPDFITAKVLGSGGYEYYEMSKTSQTGLQWSTSITPSDVGEYQIVDYIIMRSTKTHTEPSALSFISSASETTTPASPVANFFVGHTVGSVAYTAWFTDASDNFPTSWTWDFGDGETSHAQNPAHTYTEAGTYTVSLIATNDQGSDTITKTNYVTVLTQTGSARIRIPQGAPITAYSSQTSGMNISAQSDLYEAVTTNIGSGYELASLMVIALAAGAIMKYLGFF